MNDKISDLILKHLKGQLSENEKHDLNLWIDKNTKNRVLFEELTDESTLNKKLQQYNRARKSILWEKTLRNIATNTEPRSGGLDKHLISWPRVAAAAALISLVSLFAYFSINQTFKADATLAQQTRKIHAGENKAILTLADGQVVFLDETGHGEIAEYLGMSVQKTGDGQIVYTADPKANMTQHRSERTKAIKYNTISTPRGGQYQIVLNDGTKVWLNAASSLKYPVNFSGEERRVELVGEAYFEVSKQESDNGKRIPFFVKTPIQTVEVLGTHFNIHSYEDEASVRTTLIEGSVRVSLNAAQGSTGFYEDNSVLLSPNQQSVIQASEIRVMPADIEAAIGWKDGYYKFNSEELGSIMRKISRWYDVDVVFQGNTAKDKFGGKISRRDHISKVLEVIGETGNVDFKIEDFNGRKRIIVIPNVSQ